MSLFDAWLKYLMNGVLAFLGFSIAIILAIALGKVITWPQKHHHQKLKQEKENVHELENRSKN